MVMKIEIFEFLDDLAQATAPALTQDWLYIGLMLLSMVAVFITFYLALRGEKVFSAAEILQMEINKMQQNCEDLLCPPREVYYQFVSALKQFLKNKLLINVDAKMDAEIPTFVKQAGMKAELVAELDDILQRAYQVRFAHLTIEPEVIRKDVFWLHKLLAYGAKFDEKTNIKY